MPSSSFLQNLYTLVTSEESVVLTENGVQILDSSLMTNRISKYFNFGELEVSFTSNA